MIILIDFDSIICDFLGEVVRLHNLETGDNAAVQDVNQWHFKFKNGSNLLHYFGRPDFYDNAPPIPGAIEYIQKLMLKHEVYIVSSATYTHAPAGKYLWLDRHMPFFPREKVIFTASKNIVRGDCLIDDYPQNIVEWKKFNTFAPTYTLKYTYNQDGLYTLRADNWHEIYTHIDRHYTL